MQAHIFRGPGRVFGVTEDATGANLPSRFGPWTAFKPRPEPRWKSDAGGGCERMPCRHREVRFSYHRRPCSHHGKCNLTENYSGIALMGRKDPQIEPGRHKVTKINADSRG
jgi:hypothetical protein